MSKADQTRQFIIEKAATIFNIKGYNSTSLADVQEVTGLTKGAIYGNFSDKNELAIAVYEYNCSNILTRINAVLNSQTSAKEALLTYASYYLQNWREIFKRGGCPMLNAAVEADDHLHFMRNNVRKSMKYVMKKLQTIIEKGQAGKEFKSEIIAEEYAAVIFSIIEGNILLSKIMDDPKYLQLTTDRITHIIEQELAN